MEEYTKENLLNIIDAIPMLITVIDQEGKVFLANDNIRKFTGKKWKDLLGYRAGVAFGCIHSNYPDDCANVKECDSCKLRNVVLETLQTKEPKITQVMSFPFKKMDEKFLQIHTKIIHIENQDMVLLSVKDLTIQKKQEEQNIKLEQYQAAKKTIGSILHEINQPLQAIMGYTELMKLGYNEKHTTKINDNIIRMTNILQKIRQIKAFKTKPYTKTSEILDIEESLNGDTK